jgi:hypothetical protein
MTDFETAKQQVERYVNERWTEADHAGPLLVLKHIEKPYGWVFFYTAQKYWETRDIKYAVGGNGPIIFDRRTGKLHQLGSATHPDLQIQEWESENWKE